MVESAFVRDYFQQRMNPVTDVVFPSEHPGAADAKTETLCDLHQSSERREAERRLNRHQLQRPHIAQRKDTHAAGLGYARLGYAMPGIKVYVGIQKHYQLKLTFQLSLPKQSLVVQIRYHQRGTEIIFSPAEQVGAQSTNNALQ